MLSKVQIKAIHSLQHKKYRQKSGHFLAEGVKVVEELLTEHTIEVKNIYALPSWIEQYSALAGTHKNLIITPVTDRELKNISALTHPNEALAICKIPAPPAIPLLKGRVTLLLEAIRDPGNMGSIIRIADWFALPQIICSHDCVDVYNPKTVQATMGSLSRVKVWSGDLKTLLQNRPDIPLFATTLEGRALTEFEKIDEGILAIGNESSGLSQTIIKRANECITIPRLGGAESLNAAIATGIICSRLLL